MARCHITRFAGPPTTAPLASGDHYVDTTNNNTYLSVGTATVSDWVLIDSNGTATNANNIQNNTDAINAIVFGTEAQDFIDAGNTNITSATPVLVRSFPTSAKPVGRYRIQITWHYEPAATGSNTRFNLAVDTNQIGLEYEDEGKDVGGDIRRVRTIVGYYQHSVAGAFDIELYASRQAGTGVLHGVQAEVWRVS